MILVTDTGLEFDMGANEIYTVGQLSPCVSGYNRVTRLDGNKAYTEFVSRDTLNYEQGKSTLRIFSCGQVVWGPPLTK